MSKPGKSPLDALRSGRWRGEAGSAAALWVSGWGGFRAAHVMHLLMVRLQDSRFDRSLPVGSRWPWRAAMR